jgi:hypothetical protein
MLRGLFERLEQSVKATPREHVDLINDIYLIPPAGRRILDIVEQLAGIFDAGARSCIDLDKIHEPALIYFLAAGALSTRGSGNPLLAVKAFGKDTGNCGLSDAAGPAEQIGVVYPPLIEGVTQGT